MAASAEDRHRRRRIIRVVLGVWSVIVGVILLWQALTYRGLMALAAEWQFNAFGRYYPTLTYVLIVAILASPVLYLLRPPPEDDAERRPYDQPALPGRSFIRILGGIAAGCWLAAIVVAITMFALPGAGGPVNRLVIGAPGAAEPRLGPTILVGDAVRDRVAGFDEDLLLAHRSTRFVPMLSPGGRSEEVRFFAEVANPDTLAAAQRDGSVTGILRRDGLPGELVRLFRYAGFDVADPYYVLYATGNSLTWSSRVAAIELFLAGLVCAIVAVALHFRRERRRRALLGDTRPAA